MNSHLAIINLIASGILLITIIWLIIRTNRLESIRKHFYSSGLKKNLEMVLAEHNELLIEVQKHLSNTDQQIINIRDLNKNNFQKMGFVRFSAFGEAGNLSFALALLDDHDNGLLISSLHGRDSSQIYAKDIKNGKTKAKLTEEETQALNQIFHG